MRAAAAAILLILSLAIISCEDVVSDALGLTSVEASDGKYSDRIVVTWDAITKNDAEGNPLTLTSYALDRTPGGVVTPSGGVTGTSYTDTTVTAGVSYTYSVTATFSDSSTKSADLTDSGYAMDAASLSIYSSSGDGVVSYTTGAGDAWFNILGQEGWIYRVTVTGGAGVSLYREGSIATAIAPLSSEGGTVRYRLPRTGTYHLKLAGGSGTVSVSHE
jgi:hypothetical protein